MNKSLSGRLLVLSFTSLISVISSLAAAQSIVEGRTAQDRRFVAGGIGLDESEQMKSAAADFPLSVVVATKSGAYLAGTHIRIEDAHGQTVLDTQLDSPYLLVDLSRGKYRIEAKHQAERQQQSVEIAGNTRARVVFSFDVPG